jgi:serine/threonine-protein kinase RsbW
MSSVQRAIGWEEVNQARPGVEPWHRQEVRSLDEMKEIIEAIIDAMSRLRYPGEDRFGMRLSLEEAFVNAVEHGHQGDQSKAVEVGYHVEEDRVLAEIRDQGAGFDPHQIPSPLHVDGLGRASGRGVFLMRSFMTWIRYNQRGNCVTLCKCRTMYPRSTR